MDNNENNRSYNAGYNTPPMDDGSYNTSYNTPPMGDGSYNGASDDQANGTPYTDSIYYNQYNERTMDENSNDIRPVLILVLGILSIVCCCFPLPIGIAPVVLYLVGKDTFPYSKKSMAQAGFICGIVGVAIFVLSLLLLIIGSIVSNDITPFIS